MPKALVLDGTVVQIADIEFDVHESFEWVTCPDSCKAGWSYIDEQFISNEPSEEESYNRAKNNVRAVRNKKLNETDWVVVKYNELGKEVPTEWKDYRSILRNITQQEGFPFDVIWPERPR